MAARADSEAPEPSAPAVIEERDDDRPWHLPYVEGQTIPPGYAIQKQRRTGVLIGGGAALAVGYAASYVIGAVVNGRHLAKGEIPSVAYYTLYIPIAGPFIGLETIGPNTAEAVALIASAALQIAGGTTVIVGLTTHDKRLVRTAGVDLELGLAPGGAALLGRF